ncbi:FMN-binding negative transcriptional regulator [Vibrio profundum]|uniref:FMN-binding negative transcriptional regulator n=1 Tax=Vibrio profundum TaxID=2910247 RepID=UPI003D13A561
MYIPNKLEMKDDNAIIDFIAEFSFGLLISPDLEATHMPLLYVPEEGAKGQLYGHFAKANPQWKQLEGERVLVIFNGPHAYISPTWYTNKPAVPTWNYAAIHCYGTVELLSENDAANTMDTLINKYEPELLSNKDIMPDDYQHKLRQAIVPFRIVVDKIQAKEKLGQHRKTGDQQGVYFALQESQHPDANVLAEYMNKRELGTGK